MSDLPSECEEGACVQSHQELVAKCESVDINAERWIEAAESALVLSEDGSSSWRMNINDSAQ